FSKCTDQPRDTHLTCTTLFRSVGPSSPFGEAERDQDRLRQSVLRIPAVSPPEGSWRRLPAHGPGHREDERSSLLFHRGQGLRPSTLHGQSSTGRDQACRAVGRTVWKGCPSTGQEPVDRRPRPGTCSSWAKMRPLTIRTPAPTSVPRHQGAL